MALDTIDLLSIDISLYFEVHGAEVYGGENSTGYVKLKLEGVVNNSTVPMISDSEALNQWVDYHRRVVAERLEVTPENVVSVTRNTYEEETGDEDIDTDEFEEDDLADEYEEEDFDEDEDY